MITQHSDRLRARHSPAQIFELVSDVERYPEFIPYLATLRILYHEQSGAMRTFVAEAIARYKFVREKFVSRVTTNADDFSVSVELVEGPFHVLKNTWQLSPLSDGTTRINFDLAFQFNNVVLDVLFRANKQRAVNELIDRFGKEAARRYPLVGENEWPDLRTLKT
ncbi:MAG: ubiquinone-binding protein [Hyphobacterium sp.]|nr:MAG: ubiquinone-binding protein [Hyphobacterium sp.]